MVPYGIEADMAMARDHFIAVSLNQVAEDFFFAVGEMVLEPVGIGLLKGLQYFPGDRGRERCAAVQDILDRFQEVNKRGVLQDIAVCAIAETAEEAIFVLEDGMHDDIGV